MHSGPDHRDLSTQVLISNSRNICMHSSHREMVYPFMGLFAIIIVLFVVWNEYYCFSYHIAMVMIFLSEHSINFTMIDNILLIFQIIINNEVYGSEKIKILMQLDAPVNG